MEMYFDKEDNKVFCCVKRHRVELPFHTNYLHIVMKDIVHSYSSYVFSGLKDHFPAKAVYSLIEYHRRLCSNPPLKWELYHNLLKGTWELLGYGNHTIHKIQVPSHLVESAKVFIVSNKNLEEMGLPLISVEQAQHFMKALRCLQDYQYHFLKN